MEISIKLDGSYAAVYVDGRCVHRDLSPSEADRLARELINQSFARPRL